MIRNQLDSGGAEFSASFLEEGSYDIRHISHEIGQIMLLGHCLASDEQILHAANKAAASGNPAVLTYLPGSFSTVVEGCDKTTLMTDLAGQFPLFYGRRGPEIRFGTDIEAVAEHTGGMPSRRGLITEIVAAQSSLFPEVTLYDGVSRLPGAHKLEITPHRIAVAPYDTLAPRPFSSYDETIVAVRGALTEAVNTRVALGHKVSSDFSGGYDSSALAFLAKNALGSQKLDVFHAHYPVDVSGDLRQARELALANKAIALHTIELPDKTFDIRDGQTDVEATVVQRLYGTISQSGSSIHLNGLGADALFSVSPAYLTDLWHDGKWRNSLRLTKDILAFAQVARKDPRQVLHNLRHNNPHATFDEALFAIAQDLRTNVAKPNRWLHYNPAMASIITDTARCELAELIEATARSSALDPSIGAADQRAIEELRSSGSAAAHLRAGAHAYGVAVHTPFLDHSVIRAALQIPASMRHSNHQFKKLLVDALRDDVPDEIFARSMKGGYTVEQFNDMREQASVLQDLLGKKSFLSLMGILQPQALHDAVNSTAMGHYTAPSTAITQAAKLEHKLRDRYELPASVSVSSEPYRAAPRTTAQLPHGPVFIPKHICLAEDAAGLVMYNLRTKELLSLNTDAANVVKAMQERDDTHAISEAIESLYAETTGNHDARITTGAILGHLAAKGFIASGSYRPYEISYADQTLDAQASEVRMVLGRVDTKSIEPRDYIDMFLALRKAVKLLGSRDLAVATDVAAAVKHGASPGDPDRVYRLLLAGHALGRYYPARTACQELSLATVIAEAKRGRRVDWSIGVARDPREIHAWPEVDGVPIQTAHDTIVNGKYTKLGTW